MDQGELVPDEVVIGMVRQRIEEPDCHRGVILDGFPRTLQQAEALDRVLTDMRACRMNVIKIEVSAEDLMKRLAGRRTCLRCGAQYHVVYDPPTRSGVCNGCGGELYQREDDQQETIRARLAVYCRETLPLDGFYERAGILKRVDGCGGVQEVFRRVQSVVGDFGQ
jgi:adenylate kinase